MKWYLLVWQRFAEFGGRSRRMEYWMFVLFYFVTLLVLGLGIGGFGLIRQPALGAFCVFVCAAYGLVALIPGLACAVRRLHDTGKSGWLVLLGLVPIANLVLLVFLALPGDPGANQYGPNPKQPEQSAAIG